MRRNKLLVLLMILTCALTLLAGCGGQKNEPAADENSWFELDSETGILTVRIPDETPDFDWYFVVGDEKVIELLTQETTDDTYVASFRALEDGESQLTFSYVKNDEVIEARLLEVRCEGGNVAEVINDGIVDMTGENEE
ncbi:MAG: hypothetical protein ACI4LZ_05875 [Anaerovoracaceae bacterium]